MAKRDFNLKTSLVYSKDIIDAQNTEGGQMDENTPTNASKSAVPDLEIDTPPIQDKVVVTAKTVKNTSKTDKSKAKSTKNKLLPSELEARTQQTFRMTKTEYDFIKGMIVYQRMNGKPTFTRGDAIALWVEWIKEKCPTVQPFEAEL
jgi:hypothetical protein